MTEDQKPPIAIVGHIGVENLLSKMANETPENLIIVDAASSEPIGIKNIGMKYLDEGSLLMNAAKNHFRDKIAPFKRVSEKVGRNDACPCGSTLKYKKCCMPKT